MQSIEAHTICLPHRCTRCQQCGAQPCMPSHNRSYQSSDSLRICFLNVSPGIQQQASNPHMAGARCQHERGLAQKVDAVYSRLWQHFWPPVPHCQDNASQANIADQGASEQQLAPQLPFHCKKNSLLSARGLSCKIR